MRRNQRGNSTEASACSATRQAPRRKPSAIIAFQVGQLPAGAWLNISAAQPALTMAATAALRAGSLWPRPMSSSTPATSIASAASEYIIPITMRCLVRYADARR